MELNIIQNKIYEIRGQKVMLDYDLAAIYGVETKQLKRAVNRNRSHFPLDFLFQLTKKEYDSLRYQNGTLEKGKGRGKYSKYLPFAFTELGIAMLSSVLKSESAIQMNIIIMRIFVLVRQHGLSYKQLHEKIDKLEKKYKKDYRTIMKAIQFFSDEQTSKNDFDNRRRIGFK